MGRNTENSEKNVDELANAILQNLEKKSGRRLQENHLLPAGEDRRRQRGEFKGALFAIEIENESGELRKAWLEVRVMPSNPLNSLNLYSYFLICRTI